MHVEAISNGNFIRYSIGIRFLVVDFYDIPR